jgi:hypothetical protein
MVVYLCLKSNVKKVVYLFTSDMSGRKAHTVEDSLQLLREVGRTRWITAELEEDLEKASGIST